MAKLTEGVIARSIWLEWGRQGLAAPNIKHFPFESDLLVMRDSGNLIEYEIKLTKSDFLADQKKVARVSSSNNRVPGLWSEYKQYSRWDYLLSGMGANMFYYVVPEHLRNEIEIPEWAGIIECRETEWPTQCHVMFKRKGVILHRNKADEVVKNKILRSTYYRYWQNFADTDLDQTKPTTRK